MSDVSAAKGYMYGYLAKEADTALQAPKNLPPTGTPITPEAKAKAAKGKEYGDFYKKEYPTGDAFAKKEMQFGSSMSQPGAIPGPAEGSKPGAQSFDWAALWKKIQPYMGHILGGAAVGGIGGAAMGGKKSALIMAMLGAALGGGYKWHQMNRGGQQAQTPKALPAQAVPAKI